MTAADSAFHTVLADIATHLRIALLQSLPGDDRTIVGHIRDSLAVADAALSIGAEKRWAA